jgi:hypothetical protein
MQDRGRVAWILLGTAAAVVGCGSRKPSLLVADGGATSDANYEDARVQTLDTAGDQPDADRQNADAIVGRDRAVDRFLPVPPPFDGDAAPRPDGGVAFGDGAAASDGMPGRFARMTFFVTSRGSGRGGDLGGIEEADRLCLRLAFAAGATNRSWRAYLSTSAVNARDRIGKGPWFNAAGRMVASSVEDLHPAIDPSAQREVYIRVRPAPALLLDENGQTVSPREHAILTGSTPAGTVSPVGTCQDWLSSDPGLRTVVGHSDIPANDQFSPSWNSADVTLGCGLRQLVQTQGSGLLYCFAELP